MKKGVVDVERTGKYTILDENNTNRAYKTPKFIAISAVNALGTTLHNSTMTKSKLGSYLTTILSTEVMRISTYQGRECSHTLKRLGERELENH
jgi:hypothetical protein